MPGGNNDWLDADFGITGTREGETDVLSFLDEEETTTTEETTKPPVKKTETPKKGEKSEETTEEAPVDKKDPLSLLEEDDEEKEETKEEDPEEGDETSDENTEDESKFSVYAQELENMGIFTKDEGEEAIVINTPEEFAARFKKEYTKGAVKHLDAFLGNFGEDYREMFDAVFGNGVPPKEYLERYAKLLDLSEITEDKMKSEETQEGVLRSLYKKDGLPAEKVEAKIQRLKNLGELENEATDALEILKRRESDELQNITQRTAQETERKAAERRQYVQSINNILVSKMKEKDFDGIPVDQDIAKRTFDMLAKGDFQKKIAELEQPINHAKQVKVALLLQMLDEDPTLSRIKKRAVSQDKNVAFNRLLNKQKTTEQIKKSPKTSTTKDDFFI